jgi:hypothetical protein
MKLFPFYFIRTPINSFNSLAKEPKELLNNETLFTASYDLYGSNKRHLKDKLNTKKKVSYKHSMLKYALRSATRPTPFGLLSGFCSLDFNDSNDEKPFLIRKGELDYTKTTRLDMDFLCSLSQHLVKIPEIRNKLNYSPNTSIYGIGDNYRFVEYYYYDTIESLDQKFVLLS